MPSAQRRRVDAVRGGAGRRSIGRSGSSQARSPPPASSSCRMRASRWRARASSASSRRFARIPGRRRPRRSASGSRRSGTFARSVVPPRAPPSAQPERRPETRAAKATARRSDEGGGASVVVVVVVVAPIGRGRCTRTPSADGARSDGTPTRGATARGAVDAIAERVMRTTKARRRAMCARRASDRGAPPGEDRANDRRGDATTVAMNLLARAPVLPGVPCWPTHQF